MELGVSVYLSQPFIEQEAYLNKAAAAGFNVLFTSLHIPEDDASLYAERLKQVGMFAKANHMRLICDVSPDSMKLLNLSWQQASNLKEWGVTGLRIDYGVANETVVRLSKEMQIVLNASTLDHREAIALRQAGLDPNKVEAWHNFYPRPETGLSRENFGQTNTFLSEMGFSVMAFIPGDIPRAPLFKGLPTLEDHREMSPFASFLDLYEGEGIETILVGDKGLSDSSFEQFHVYHNEKAVLLRVQAAGENVVDLEEKHRNRKDAARDVLRSESSRSFASIGKRNVTPANTVARPIGTVTIDNNRYGRYQGEVQITKTDLPADVKVNVLGRVIDADVPLIKHIKGGQNWKIKWM